ncbi:MAG: hypothetical protein RIR00_425 [Pseudomonadota bacterium]
MLIDFFLHLKARNLPVSTREFLTLLDALRQGVAGQSLDAFYFLARTCLVKDERLYDRFDQAFALYFKNIEDLGQLLVQLPDDWLAQAFQKDLSPEQRAAIQKLGWDKLMEEFRKRLVEQQEAHHGGSKWIGTGGTSPFGHSGQHPEGVRVDGESKTRSAVKVWAQREYRNLDDSVELGTRNIKVALRRLRQFAREGAAEELDLDDTIASTARNAGWLDLKLRPERHNKVKVLLVLDVGGSMDDHIKVCEEVFSAARAEFKHLEHFYFHNCVYEHVWKDSRRRHDEKIPLWDVIHRYGEDYKLIFVGDASMSPYEITHPGAAIEHTNREAGATWLRRLLDQFPAAVWLNPEAERFWEYRPSIQLIHEILGARMFPLTLGGLDRAMRRLMSAL